MERCDRDLVPVTSLLFQPLLYQTSWPVTQRLPPLSSAEINIEDTENSCGDTGALRRRIGYYFLPSLVPHDFLLIIAVDDERLFCIKTCGGYAGYRISQYLRLHIGLNDLHRGFLIFFLNHSRILHSLFDYSLFTINDIHAFLSGLTLDAATQQVITAVKTVNH